MRKDVGPAPGGSRVLRAALVDLLLAGQHLRVNTALEVRVPVTWGFARRRNTDWHLIHVLSGSGWYDLDGQKVRLEQGRLILVSPGLEHGAWPEVCDPPTIQPLRFSVEPDRGCRGAPWSGAPCACHVRVTGTAHDRIARRLGEVVHRQALPRTDSGIILDQADLVAAMEPLGEPGSVAVDARGDAIERLCREIRTRPGQRWDVETMAKRLGWSPKHAIRAFRQRVAETPHAFVIRARIERACYLLEASALAIAAIAEDLGYPDASSFGKQFRRLHQASPGEWRRRHRR